MTTQVISRPKTMTIRNYWEAGLNPIPIRDDGSKAAAVPWKEYISRRARTDEIESWEYSYWSFAFVNGWISRGQETIDVDDPQCVKQLLSEIDPLLRARLVINNTPRGGVHIMSRCSKVCASMKIALDENGKVRIESRGEGAYTIAPGSAPSTHKSGKPYTIRQWPNYPHLPVITPAERVTLWQCCLKFDDSARHVEVERKKLYKSKIGPYISRQQSGYHPRPDLGVLSRLELQKAGWTTTDDQTYTRPGKADGTSGKFNTTLTDGSEIFTVFSSNAGGLSPEDGHKNWSLDRLIQALHAAETDSKGKK